MAYERLSADLLNVVPLAQQDPEALHVEVRRALLDDPRSVVLLRVKQPAQQRQGVGAQEAECSLRHGAPRSARVAAYIHVATPFTTAGRWMNAAVLGASEAECLLAE
eukprot:11888979-Alexandrium_andersonii.AAC.1